MEIRTTAASQGPPSHPRLGNAGSELEHAESKGDVVLKENIIIYDEQRDASPGREDSAGPQIGTDISGEGRPSQDVSVSDDERTEEQGQKPAEDVARPSLAAGAVIPAEMGTAPSPNRLPSGVDIPTLPVLPPSATRKDLSRRELPLICHIVGCNVSLSSQAEYYQRYRICRDHLRAGALLVDGEPKRFCQQCGRFHPLDSFDGEKRNCRARLLQHNSRRRKAGIAGHHIGGAGGPYTQRRRTSVDYEGLYYSYDEEDAEDEEFKPRYPVHVHSSSLLGGSGELRKSSSDAGMLDQLAAAAGLEYQETDEKRYPLGPRAEEQRQPYRVVSKPHTPYPLGYEESSREDVAAALRQQIHNVIAAQRHFSEPSPRPHAWLSVPPAAPSPPAPAFGYAMPQSAALSEQQMSQTAIQELERLLGRQLLLQLLQGAGYPQQSPQQNTTPVIGIPAAASSSPASAQMALDVVRNLIARGTGGPGTLGAPPARGVPLSHNHSAPPASAQYRGFGSVGNVQDAGRPTDLKALKYLAATLPNSPFESAYRQATAGLPQGQFGIKLESSQPTEPPVANPFQQYRESLAQQLATALGAARSGTPAQPRGCSGSMPSSPTAVHAMAIQPSRVISGQGAAAQSPTFHPRVEIDAENRQESGISNALQRLMNVLHAEANVNPTGVREQLELLLQQLSAVKQRSAMPGAATSGI